MRIRWVKRIGRNYFCLQASLPCDRVRQLASAFWHFFTNGGHSSFPFTSRHRLSQFWLQEVVSWRLTLIPGTSTPPTRPLIQLSITLSFWGGMFHQLHLVGLPTSRRGARQTREKREGESWDKPQVHARLKGEASQVYEWECGPGGLEFQDFQKKKPEIQTFHVKSAFHIFSSEICDYAFMSHRAPDFFILHFLIEKYLTYFSSSSM